METRPLYCAITNVCPALPADNTICLAARGGSCFSLSLVFALLDLGNVLFIVRALLLILPSPSQLPVLRIAPILLIRERCFCFLCITATLFPPPGFLEGRKA